MRAFGLDSRSHVTFFGRSNIRTYRNEKLTCRFRQFSDERSICRRAQRCRYGPVARLPERGCPSHRVAGRNLGRTPYSCGAKRLCARCKPLRSLPHPPAAVFPSDGPCLRPNGGGAVHALAAALRRRRAPGKDRRRGLTRVSTRMLPYLLPARAREMHVRVQRRAKKRGAGR